MHCSTCGDEVVWDSHHLTLTTEHGHVCRSDHDPNQDDQGQHVVVPHRPLDCAAVYEALHPLLIRLVPTGISWPGRGRQQTALLLTVLIQRVRGGKESRGAARAMDVLEVLESGSASDDSIAVAVRSIHDGESRDWVEEWLLSQLRQEDIASYPGPLQRYREARRG